MIRLRPSATALAVVLSIASAAAAQVPTIPIRILSASPYFYDGTDPIASLSMSLSAGNWIEMQTTGVAMLKKWCSDPYKKANGPALCDGAGDVAANYYNIVW